MSEKQSNTKLEYQNLTSRIETTNSKGKESLGNKAYYRRTTAHTYDFFVRI